jgi:HSP20 family protein
MAGSEERKGAVEMTATETKPAEIEESAPRAETRGGWFSEIEPFLSQRFSDLFPTMGRLLPGRVSMESLAPRVDIFDQDGELVVKADLPGVKKENISLSVENGALLIKGERDDKTEVKEKDYYKLERSSGSYVRYIPVPAGVKAEDITATYADGTLEIHVNKPENVAPMSQQIPIS